MKKSIVLFTVLITSAASATAHTLTLAEKNKSYAEFVQAEKLSDIDNIRSFRYTGWKALSDDYLVITNTKKEDYLIEFKSRCLGLSKAKAVKLNRFSDSSLSSQYDTVSVVGPAAETCRIESIYPISAEQSLTLSKV
ncbi:DUF6491 family protein [Paraglaciecola hydrolytica]|uniref:Uncharacterized protein n=1 Tax=Paraglaciecola hydrolytica TaxID=1799789 RepID=A0A136A523_9ALTE|nr:DUF6491 family protein [Paraglaciecola hydrolytica]KXI30342.1 hypothetical protein AX660_10215 [Paraglaciecola hydrolytica]